MAGLCHRRLGRAVPFVYADDEWTDLGALTVPQYPDPDGRLSLWVEGFVMARPTDTLSLLKDNQQWCVHQISYQSRDTEGTQAPIETLDRRWGSCRDLAVLFAEAARTLGLGSRIVSGYLSDAEECLLGSAGSGSTMPGSRYLYPVPDGLLRSHEPKLRVPEPDTTRRGPNIAQVTRWQATLSERTSICSQWRYS